MATPDILKAKWSLGSVMVGGVVDLAPALTSGLVTVDDGAGGMTGIVIVGPDAIAVAIAVTALPEVVTALKAALDNIQGIADEDDIPSTHVRQLGRAALAKAGAAS